MLTKTQWTMYILRLSGAVLLIAAACWWVQGIVEKLRAICP